MEKAGEVSELRGVRRNFLRGAADSAWRSEPGLYMTLFLRTRERSPWWRTSFSLCTARRWWTAGWKEPTVGVSLDSSQHPMWRSSAAVIKNFQLRAMEKRTTQILLLTLSIPTRKVSNKEIHPLNPLLPEVTPVIPIIPPVREATTTGTTTGTKVRLLPTIQVERLAKVRLVAVPYNPHLRTFLLRHAVEVLNNSLEAQQPWAGTSTASQHSSNLAEKLSSSAKLPVS